MKQVLKSTKKLSRFFVGEGCPVLDTRLLQRHYELCYVYCPLGGGLFAVPNVADHLLRTSAAIFTLLHILAMDSCVLVERLRPRCTML